MSIFVVAAVSVLTGCSPPVVRPGTEYGTYYCPAQPNYLMGLAGGTAGVLGAQIGQGNGRVAASAAGAALGTLAGTGCPLNGGAIIGGAAGGLLDGQIGRGKGQGARGESSHPPSGLR